MKAGLPVKMAVLPLRGAHLSQPHQNEDKTPEPLPEIWLNKSPITKDTEEAISRLVGGMEDMEGGGPTPTCGC